MSFCPKSLPNQAIDPNEQPTETNYWQRTPGKIVHGVGFGALAVVTSPLVAAPAALAWEVIPEITGVNPIIKRKETLREHSSDFFIALAGIIAGVLVKNYITKHKA